MLVAHEFIDGETAGSAPEITMATTVIRAGEMPA